jgi:hypothetical protein
MPIPSTDEGCRAHDVEVLEQVLDVAVRAASYPELVLLDRDGRRLVRIATEAQGSMSWKDERRAMPVAEPEPVPSFDRVRTERICRELPRSQIQIECDLFPGIGAIKEPGRPQFAPAVFLAVNAEGGAVVRVEMHEPAGHRA